jgi:hypothetical protein
MLLASQMTFGWSKEEKGEHTPVYVADVTMPDYDPDDGPLTEQQIAQIKEEIDHEAMERLTDPNAPTEEELKINDESIKDIGDIIPGDHVSTEDELTANTSELDKWNKMIEEAEREAAKAQDDQQLKDRLASGESYINAEGSEISLDIDLPEDESKKKTYMIKDELGQIQTKIKE